MTYITSVCKMMSKCTKLPKLYIKAYFTLSFTFFILSIVLKFKLRFTPKSWFMVFPSQVHVETNQNRSFYINQACQKWIESWFTVSEEFSPKNLNSKTMIINSFFTKLQMVLFSQHMVFMHGRVHVFWILEQRAKDMISRFYEYVL